jgi:hypothetical protein
MSQNPNVLDIITGVPTGIDCRHTLCPEGCIDSFNGKIVNFAD